MLLSEPINPANRLNPCTTGNERQRKALTQMLDVGPDFIGNRALFLKLYCARTKKQRKMRKFLKINDFLLKITLPLYRIIKCHAIQLHNR
jgi:hypothetical protein